MRIGLVLPTMVPRRPARSLTHWARGAEEAGFSTVAVFDRVVYDSYEPLTALAAAAAVTERVSLMTALAIAPLRTNTALFAKQAATVDHLSEGRLVLGLGVGIREDDFTAGGVPLRGRGAATDRQLAELRRIWTADADRPDTLGPRPARPGGVPLVLGGHTPAAIRRAARSADGWIAGSGGLPVYEHGAGLLEAAWAEEGREGKPRTTAVGYFALGRNGAKAAEEYLGAYMAFADPGYTEAVVRSTPTGGEALRRTVAAYASRGCDELLLAPCSAEPEQLELLAAELDGLLDAVPDRLGDAVAAG
ncbi:LLM class flavin-dependent oxidoreductase [Streptomyces sp. NPDC005805]|uniref:LLM class flavin-dependent oxidoreductase n=1 Tax=Streptomyces sp. NPDC005805 TaxID=3157068 RepID=UPI0033D93977